jgi:hypothetical protein
MRLRRVLAVATLLTVLQAHAIYHMHERYPVVIMNACSDSPHKFVGTDGSLLVRRSVNPDIGVRQFCQLHADLLSPAACNRTRAEVRCVPLNS